MLITPAITRLALMSLITVIAQAAAKKGPESDGPRAIAFAAGPVPDVDTFMKSVERRFPHSALYVQAVREMAESVMPHIAQHPMLHDQAILMRCTEPERSLSFRVEWLTDEGEVAINRGYRVMANGALGPGKGGLRFAKSVDIATLHFLAFEQVRASCARMTRARIADACLRRWSARACRRRRCSKTP